MKKNQFFLKKLMMGFSIALLSGSILQAATSSGSWQSFSVSTQTGSFTATYDAVPNNNNMDGVTGILSGTASAYGDLACIVRFNTGGTIDARNGGAYTASNTVSYNAGTTYHFRLEINVPSHTYSVYVTPQGGSEQTVASNFAFRSEQASVSQLTGWALYAYIGSHTVTNVVFDDGSTPDTEAPSVPTGLAASNITSSSFTLSWNASTDNIGVTGYEVFKGGVSIGTTTSTSMSVSGLTASTTYSMTVRAQDAVPNWSAQSSALNVTTDEEPVGGNNLISNGEFDNGTTGWEAGNYGGTASLSAVTGQGMSGTNAMQISVSAAGTNTWDIQIYQDMAIESGKTYQISFMAKAAANRTMAAIIQDFDSPWAEYWHQDVSLTTSSQTFGPFTFNSSTTDATCRFKFFVGGNATTIYVDNIIVSDVSAPADTQAPSVPIGLLSSNITSSGFTLSWNASTDNVGVTGYEVFRNGVSIGTTTSTSMPVTGLAASTTYSMTVRARDAVPNWSAQSAPLNVTTAAASGVTSSTAWQSFAVSTQTGVFTATFDAVPNNNNMDGVTGILNGTASGYGDLACIVRFNTGGTIDARNGSSYAASNTIGYSAGTSYHFRTVISVPTKTYSVYVTPQGGSEQTVANNFSFRTEQVSVTQLTGWSLQALSGSHTVSNVTFVPAPPDTQAPSVPTGLSSSNVSSSSFTLNWNASTDNVIVTGYEVFRDGVSIGTTTTTSMFVGGLSGSTTYSMKVRAGDAVPNWSAQSAALNVTTSTGSSGGFPDASNTGTTGTLTPSGTVTVTTNGALIQNLNISGDVVIRANNVTIRNCKFYRLKQDVGNYTGTVVEDCELFWAGVKNFTLRRCEMKSASGDLIRISGGNILVEDCYLHIDGPVNPGDHSDIIQEYPLNTGFNNVVRHNTLYIAMTQNACIFKPRGMRIENNLFAGGGFTLYVQYTTVINNRFSTKFFPNCGNFGIFYPNLAGGNICSGNVWHETGAPVSCPSSAEVELATGSEQDVKVYPNPLDGNILHVAMNGYNNENVNVTIIDMMGRTVYNTLHNVVENNALDIAVEELNKGIYILSIEGIGFKTQQKLVVK